MGEVLGRIFSPTKIVSHYESVYLLLNSTKFKAKLAYFRYLSHDLCTYLKYSMKKFEVKLMELSRRVVTDPRTVFKLVPLKTCFKALNQVCVLHGYGSSKTYTKLTTEKILICAY